MGKFKAWHISRGIIFAYAPESIMQLYKFLPATFIVTKNGGIVLLGVYVCALSNAI